ncbi:EAL domain-containing protein [Pseudoalteromonas sp. G4]|uniref:EAL domain-containing protein n=1 Tax=Pseudoalteromonas sp. G4 TaxID=2992761 RepID=UPI00237DBBEB|nr:EAL domain-containing protein [Pseudoalteromonas sp. G4]MDE3273233.1 EAL domain-containing protein [Pseudoalteromonas sp. G4]
MQNKQKRILQILYFVCGITFCALAYWLFGELLGVIVTVAVILLFLLFVFIQSPPLILTKPSLKLLPEPEKPPLSVLTNNAYHVFSLLCGAVNIDEAKLTSALQQAFVSEKVSCKQLKAGRLSVTILCPQICDEAEFNKLFSEVLKTHINDCEFGACLYREPCQQLNVYQLAELALAIAKTKQQSKSHVLKLNQTNLALLQYSLPEMINDILNRQLLFHQVGITIRHQKVGLCDAKQFLLGCLDSDKLLALDEHLLKQLLKTLAQDSSNDPVLLSIDAASWYSAQAIDTLITMVETAGFSQIIRFSISEGVLVNDYRVIKQQLTKVKQRGISIVAERCHGALMKIQSDLSFLTGAYIDADIFQLSEVQQRALMNAFSEFAKEQHLQLYGAGIEAVNQLSLLVEYQFVGASGRFFQQGEHNIALGLN